MAESTAAGHCVVMAEGINQTVKTRNMEATTKGNHIAVQAELCQTSAANGETSFITKRDIPIHTWVKRHEGVVVVEHDVCGTSISAIFIICFNDTEGWISRVAQWILCKLTNGR